MRRGGLGFIILIIAAAIVLYLGASQMKSLHSTDSAGSSSGRSVQNELDQEGSAQGEGEPEEITQENAVEQAQDAVDALNDAQQQAVDQAEALD